MTPRELAPILIVAIVVVGITALIVYATRRVRGYVDEHGRAYVRCREGHLFTTIWIPGVSFKAIRLGMQRYQRCPIGGNWTLVELVDPVSLSDEERRYAEVHFDSPIP